MIILMYARAIPKQKKTQSIFKCIHSAVTHTHIFNETTIYLL